jgi:hypothetical protein
MSVFYFYDPKSDGSQIFSLAATTNISISSPASVTSSKVEDGSSIADNYFKDNKVVSFSGVITSVGVSSQDQDLSPEDWLALVEKVRDTKVRLTVVAHTEVVTNTLITGLEINKTVTEGLSGWLCDITFKQISISNRSRIAVIKEPKPEVKDKVEVKSKSSSSATKEVPLGTSAAIGLAQAAGAFTTTPLTDEEIANGVTN